MARLRDIGNFRNGSEKPPGLGGFCHFRVLMMMLMAVDAGWTFWKTLHRQADSWLATRGVVTHRPFQFGTDVIDGNPERFDFILHVRHRFDQFTNRFTLLVEPRFHFRQERIQSAVERFTRGRCG